MEKDQIRPSEIYKDTLKMLESDELTIDEQQILLDALQHLENVIRRISNSSQEARQYNFDNYLVGLSKGKIPFDIMAASFLIYQYKIRN